MTDNSEPPVAPDLNPYFAKVIAYVDINGLVSSDRQEHQQKLLINVGEEDEVKVGERVLIFALGPRIKDPDTKIDLGHFEIVRGEGKVISVQVRMAIIDSTSTRSEYRRKANSGGLLAAAAGYTAELEKITVSAPFKSPEIGDLVRFI